MTLPVSLLIFNNYYLILINYFYVFIANNNIFSYLVTLIGNEAPTDDLLISILTLKQKPFKEDFILSIFSFWSEHFSDVFSGIVVNFTKNKKTKRDHLLKLLKYFDKLTKVINKCKLIFFDII